MKILNKVVTVALAAPTYRDAAAVNEFVQAVQCRLKMLKMSVLHIRYQKLVSATQNGEPVFSWSMPQATSPNTTLTAFLRSPRAGPETIVVGGGINNARSLVGLGRSYDSYRRYSSSADNCSSDPLKQGYSASITATSATGINAAIRVTKTRALYEARVKSAGKTSWN